MCNALVVGLRVELITFWLHRNQKLSEIHVAD